MAQIDQDLSKNEIQRRPDPLPPGWYEGVVSESQIKNSTNGPYIEWIIKIVGKPNQVWDRMSLGNEVSMNRLKTMAAACGHKNPNYLTDTEELHGKSCMVKLKIETDESGQYEPKNKITAFKEKNGNSTITPTVQQASVPEAANPQPQQPAQKQKMPWEA